MAWVKRILFFAAVNIAVVFAANIIVHLAAYYFKIEITGSSYALVFYSLLGMGGAFASLAMSKWLAKSQLGVEVIDPRSANPNDRDLVDRVHAMAKAAGLTKMPEVGIFESDEVNAFATGPSRNNSLVAVSTGLRRRMNDDQVDGVLGHEVAHIANGDMVTMTLIQGVINTMVLFAAHFIAKIVEQKTESRTYYYLTYYLIQIPLGLVGSLVVNKFSRMREFRADFGGARYAGRGKMISALQALQNTQELVEVENERMASLKIAGRKATNWRALFSTHPSLEGRIAKLERARV